MYHQTKEDISSDLEAMEKAKQHPSAFRPIYERHYKRIYLFVLNKVYDKDLAAEVCAQVFFKALQKVGSFRDTGVPVTAWLYRIALNECTDFFRKTNKNRYVVLDDLFANFLKEEMEVEGSLEDQWMDALKEALSQLPEEKLQLIEMRFYEGKSFREIGEILDISESNAKVRTYRVLEWMKGSFLKSKKS